jgi:hypothetical protein
LQLPGRIDDNTLPLANEKLTLAKGNTAPGKPFGAGQPAAA